MLQIFKNDEHKRTLSNLTEPQKDSWVRMINPSRKELEQITKQLNLDMAILEDGLDENEISRVEKEDGIFYLIMRFPKTTDKLTVTVPLLLIATPHHLITLCCEEEHLTQSTATRDVHFLTSRRTHFVLHLIDAIFKLYETEVNKILKDIRRRKLNLDDFGNKDILFLVQEEETLNDFISALVPALSILEKISRGKFLQMAEDDQENIEDLVWDGRQTLELSKSGLKTIKNIREAYSAILTDDLNKVMKILTITTIFLTLPTVISSIFGMNIRLPLEDDPLAFIYLGGFTLLLILLILVIMIRKRWL